MAAEMQGGDAVPAITLFKCAVLVQSSRRQETRATGESMTAQAAPKHATSPQTPPLPQAKPEQIGLSASRLQKLSDTFKREVDKGTLPGATVLVARKGQIGWFDAIGRQSPADG